MKTSNLLLLASMILLAMNFRWSDLKRGRTLRDVYHDARTGKLRRITWYNHVTTWAGVALLTAAIYLDIKG